MCRLTSRYKCGLKGVGGDSSLHCGGTHGACHAGMTKRYSRLAPDSLRKTALSLEGSLDKKSENVIPFPRKTGES